MYKKEFKEYRKESMNFMTPDLMKIIELEREHAPDLVIELSKGKTLDYSQDFYGVSFFYAIEKQGEVKFIRDDELLELSVSFHNLDGAKNYIREKKQELKTIV